LTFALPPSTSGSIALCGYSITEIAMSTTLTSELIEGIPDPQTIRERLAQLALPLLSANLGENGPKAHYQLVHSPDGVHDHLPRAVEVQDETRPQTVRGF
jgi:hypothetical protein